MLQFWCEIYLYSVLQESTVISIVDDIVCICMMLKVARTGCLKSLLHNFVQPYFKDEANFFITETFYYTTELLPTHSKRFKSIFLFWI